ncbi:DUF3006 domain-containing protein [Halovivax cerinus]|uniref:DUF3006 domain-containing protein n=1 Tax=Halovivax cerinus TaxID=1487865 RepID=A0ABD5NLJ1_9EURY|nr:DUF3006 domain-containing protein [Halovivax cerinus]
MSADETAVLDRIVDDETAVLLLEDDGEVVDQVTLPADRLPADGRSDGAVYDLEMDDGDVVTLAYRADETESRRESAQSRFDRLAERLDDE